MSEVKMSAGIGSTSTQAGANDFINLIPQIIVGPGKDQRVGSRIKGKRISFELRVFITPVNLTVATIAQVRIMIFIPRINQTDLQTYLAALGQNTVWDPTKGYLLRKWDFVIAPLTTVGLTSSNGVQNGVVAHKRMKYSFPWRKTMTYQPSGNIPQQTNEQVWIVVITDLNALVGNITTEIHARMSYYDL